MAQSSNMKTEGESSNYEGYNILESCKIKAEVESSDEEYEQMMLEPIVRIESGMCSIFLRLLVAFLVIIPRILNFEMKFHNQNFFFEYFEMF